MINPELLHFGTINIRWYGICAAVGLLSAYWLQMYRRQKYNFTEGQVSDLTFFCMMGAIVGARLAYVIRFWDEEFAGQGIAEIFKVYNGGLVFYGGFLGAVLIGAVLCRYRHWSWGQASDLMTPALPLAHACGRIGCLLNGCCFGFPYQGPLAVDYGVHGMSVLHIQKMLEQVPPDASLPLPTFPIEGIAAIVNVLICLILLWSEKRGFAKNRLFFLYGIIYSIARFCTEFGRGDYVNLNHGLTPAQVTCLWILPVSILAFVWLTWKQPKTTPVEKPAEKTAEKSLEPSQK